MTKDNLVKGMHILNSPLRGLKLTNKRNNMKTVLIFLITLTLTSCKVFLNIPIKLSEINSANNQDNSGIYGYLSIEVGKCIDESTQFENEAVTEIRRLVTYISDGAIFIDCFVGDSKSYVRFKSILSLSADTKTTNYVNLNGKGGLSISIGSILRKKLLKNSEFKHYGNLKIIFTIENDTTQDWNYSVSSSYVNYEPVISGEFVLKKGETDDIELSDVLISIVENGNKVWVAHNKNGNNDVNLKLVKNGIMSFNRTLSIGDAFDNWNSCQTRKWKSFESTNGVKMVEFSCNAKDVKVWTKNIVNSLVSKKMIPSINLKKLNRTFRWTINRDNTFQINTIKTTLEWEDGKKVIFPSQNFQRAMQNVYEDKQLVNTNALNQYEIRFLTESYLNAK